MERPFAGRQFKRSANGPGGRFEQKVRAGQRTKFSQDAFIELKRRFLVEEAGDGANRVSICCRACRAAAAAVVMLMPATPTSSRTTGSSNCVRMRECMNDL